MSSRFQRVGPSIVAQRILGDFELSLLEVSAKNAKGVGLSISIALLGR